MPVQEAPSVSDIVEGRAGPPKQAKPKSVSDVVDAPVKKADAKPKKVTVSSVVDGGDDVWKTTVPAIGEPKTVPADDPNAKPEALPDVLGKRDLSQDPRRWLGRAERAAEPYPSPFRHHIDMQVRGAATRIVGEKTLTLPAGSLPAAWRLAGGGDGVSSLPGRYLKSIQFLFPNLGGRNPNYEELKSAAKNDENLATVVGMVDKAVAESEVQAQETERRLGAKPDWNQIERELRRQYWADPSRFGNLSANEALDQMRIPGVTRRPLTHEEAAEIITSAVKGAETKENRKLTEGFVGRIVDSSSSGIATGLQMMAAGGAATGLAAKGLSAAKSAAVAFGGLEAGKQALGVASGSRDDFSLFDIGAAAATAGIAGKAGQVVSDATIARGLRKIAGMDSKLVAADAMEKLAKRANFFGMGTTLGAVEASNKALEAILDHQQEHGPDTGFWESALNRFLEVAPSLAIPMALSGHQGPTPEMPARPYERAPRVNQAARRADLESGLSAGQEMEHRRIAMARAAIVENVKAAKTPQQREMFLDREYVDRIAQQHDLDPEIHGKALRDLALDAASRPSEQPVADLAKAFENHQDGIEPGPVTKLSAERAADKVLADRAAITAKAGWGEFTDKLAKAASLGGKMPGFEAFIRRALGSASADAAASKARWDSKVVPARLETDRAAAKIGRYLDEKTGGDPTLRWQLMHVIWTESQGTSPNGAREATSQFVTKFSPETISGGLDLFQKFIKHGTDVGRLLADLDIIPEARFDSDISINKSQFDSGEFSREDAAAGKYGKLVGGLRFHEARGGYAPHLASLSEEMSRNPWKLFGRGKGNSAAPISIEGYLADPFTRSRTMRRDLSGTQFNEAVAGSGNVVDTSYESVARALHAETDAVVKKGVLDDMRASGNIRRGNNLPVVADAPEMLARRKDITGRIGKLVEERRALMRESPRKSGRLAEVSKEISGLREEARQLDVALSPNGWTEIKGEKWGEYNETDPNKPRWYIRSDLHAELAPRGGQENAWLQTAATLHRIARSMKTGYSAAKRMLQDKFGNSIAYTDVGLHDWRTNLKRMIDNFGYHFGGKPADKFHEEFLTVSRDHFVGGPGTFEGIQKERAAQAVQRLSDSLYKGNAGDSAARALTALGTLYEDLLGRSPAGKLAKFYKTVVDEADALSAYTVARERGMSIEDAWEAVAKVADYSTLSPGMQKASAAMSMLRYPAKMGSLYGKTVPMRKATLYGANIGKPLDAVIMDAPGSKRAMAALAGRAMLNMGAKVAQIALPVYLAKKTVLAASGISDQEWDKHLNDEYKEYSAPVRELMKLVSIPTGRTELGRIGHLDLSTVMPWLAPLTFWKTSPEGGQVWQGISKNVLIAPWAQASLDRDYRGKRFDKENAGPGGQWWAAQTQFLPGLLSATISEVAKDKNLPPQERSKITTALRIIGVPLKAGEAPGKIEQQLEYFRSRGWLQMSEKEDGGSYYVANPGPMSPLVRQWIDAYYEIPSTVFQARQRLEGKQKNIEDSLKLR